MYDDWSPELARTWRTSVLNCATALSAGSASSCPKRKEAPLWPCEGRSLLTRFSECFWAADAWKSSLTQFLQGILSLTAYREDRGAH